jgi:hypothetical protein
VHLPRPHHGDDGDAGAGAKGGVAQRAAVERRADRDLPGVDAGEIAVLLAELRDELRGAEQVGQRPRLLRGERQLGEARVGVVGLGDDQIDLAVPVGDDADPAAVAQREVLAHADAGQRGDLHIHAFTVAADTLWPCGS